MTQLGAEKTVCAGKICGPYREHPRDTTCPIWNHSKKGMDAVRRVILFLATTILLAWAAARGQSTRGVTFEAVSVKPSPPLNGQNGVTGMVGGPGSGDPGRISFPQNTLADLVAIAYGVPKYRVSGPDWIDSNRYDVVAKLAPKTTIEQVRQMTRGMLADRFKLTTHMTQKNMTFYEMTASKPGPALKPSTSAAPLPSDEKLAEVTGRRPRLAKDGFPDIPAGVSALVELNDRSRMVEFHRTMAWLARRLARDLKQQVVDATELKGEYDIDLRWVNSPTPDPAGPDLIEAVRTQLGIRLTPRKGPIDIVVVDHAERVPSRN